MTPKYQVDDMTDCKENPETYYWKDCPHGCEEEECEGHLEEESRLYMVHDLFDRHDDDAGYFSKERAELISEFMRQHDAQN